MSDAPKAKNVQLSTTVTPALHDALNDYRFANRVEKIGDVLKLALAQFAEREGVSAATAAPAAPAKGDK